MTREELIAALLSAPQGSKELNGEIWWHVNKTAASHAYWNAVTGTPRPLPDDKIPDGMGRLAVYTMAPDFTGSIDVAARNLRPEGMCFDVADYISSGAAWVGPRDDPIRGFVIAATAPLALCVACLRKMPVLN